MDKKAWIGVAVVIAVGLFFVFTWQSRTMKPESIEVGAILPLSGSASLLGQGVLEGIEMAVEEINTHGGINDKHVLLVSEDSKNDPKEAVSAFYKMTTTGKPFVIISEMSSVSKALAPLAERKKVVLFSTVTAAPDLTSINKWVFRNYYSTRTQGKALANFLTTRIKPQHIGILHLTDDYGVIGKNELINALKEKGINETTAEGYAKEATDLRAQITKLQTAKVDVICVIAYDEALARAFQKIRELGYEGILCTYTGLANPKVLEQAGSSAQGAYVAMADYDPENPTEGVQFSFIANYKAKYGTLPSHYPAFGYDTFMCVARAMKGAISPDEVRERLTHMPSFEGVMGTIAISETREVEFSQTVRVVKDNKIMPIY